MYNIAGDIGGTKCWLGLFDPLQNDVLYEHIYSSADFDQGTQLIQHFIGDCQHHLNKSQFDIAQLCLALPGIVKQHQAQLTNLDWFLDAADFKQQFAIPQVTFLNDFQAAAEGVATLSQEDYRIINLGKPDNQGTRVITGAGTGLGLAWMQMSDDGYHAYATEGGHTDFAPADPEQQALLAYLRRDYQQVSWEHLLSGDGITRIYQFYYQQQHQSAPPTTPDAAAINQAAQHNDVLAQQTLHLFSRLYASWVGNIALLYQPKGGIFIAGGIASHLVDYLLQDAFKQACFQKGKMQHLVEQTPIYLITNTRLGLQGAALVAKRHCVASKK